MLFVVLWKIAPIYCVTIVPTESSKKTVIMKERVCTDVDRQSWKI